MFQNVLKDIVENTDGAVASVLMGFDGITVDSYVVDSSELNVETIGMEYTVALSQIRQAAELLEMGTAREVAVQAENMTTVMRLLNDEYFIALAILPSGNFGKGRFLLRTHAQQLVENLT
jgi:predicted regulator of Ras-like GTPase activity (Roadblock/LC7/MglB family)